MYDQWLSNCAATRELSFKPPSLATKNSKRMKGCKVQPMSLVCMEHKVYSWYERIMKTPPSSVEARSGPITRIIMIVREAYETGCYHAFCAMVVELAPKPKGPDEESSEEESEDDPNEEVFIRMN